MSSDRKIAASRANGKLSRGPKTPEGRRRSSINAVRHGLLARTALLQCESPEAFREFLADYLQRFGPLDIVETGIVEEMATACWRLRRAWAIETRLLDDGAASLESGDAIGRLTASFSTLAGSPQFHLVHRYETRLHRIFQRALQNLTVLRKDFFPNEPNPGSGHSPSSSHEHDAPPADSHSQSEPAPEKP
jgi:hypothetical protein